MLQIAVFAIGCLFLLAAAVVALTGPTPPSIELAVIGLLLAGGVVFERWRYKIPTQERPDPNWQFTGERFFDPGTGREMEVYFDPRTGRREYVETEAERRP